MARQGRKRKAEITIAAVAALDAPDIRLIRAATLGFETIETAVGGSTRAKYRKIETPFDQARRHGWITADQYRAADLMCLHFQRAGLMPRTTMNWAGVIDGSREGGSSDPRDRHARQFRDGLAAVPAEYRDGFLSWFIQAQSEDLPIADLGAYFIELKHYESQKAVGILVIRKCLEPVARAYGVSS